jgi:hypothetical protein
MQLSVNLSHLPIETRRAVVKGIRHEDRARHVLGLVEQLKLKRLADQIVQPGFNNDVGRTAMIVSPGQYQAAQMIYGERCWADPEFSKFLLKHHPEFRVKDVGTRIQSGYTGTTQNATWKPAGNGGSSRG